MESAANVQAWISESRKICEALIFLGRPGAAQLLPIFADTELAEISRKMSPELPMDTTAN